MVTIGQVVAVLQFDCNCSKTHPNDLSAPYPSKGSMLRCLNTFKVPQQQAS